MSDHYEEAEKLIRSLHYPNLEQAVQLAIAHGLLALVEGVDELIEHLASDDDDEEEVEEE